MDAEGTTLWTQKGIDGMTEPIYEPAALGVYRRTLGAAADNQAVVMAEDLAADAWIEELEVWQADGLAHEQMREAFDFAVALQSLDSGDTDAECVGQRDAPHRGKRRIAIRARIPRIRALRLDNG